MSDEKVFTLDISIRLYRKPFAKYFHKLSGSIMFGIFKVRGNISWNKIKENSND